MSPKLPTIDGAVVARARAGDLAAQHALYERFAPMVYTLARRILATAASAEDVVQDTFVEVLAKLDSYRGESELVFWIRRIAINKALGLLRSGWTSRRIDAADENAFAESAARCRAETECELERALGRLSASARTVVWLHDVEGYTHREIARLLGRTASFSKSQLARAHERLRVELDGYDESESLLWNALKTC